MGIAVYPYEITEACTLLPVAMAPLVLGSCESQHLLLHVMPPVCVVCVLRLAVLVWCLLEWRG